jgi:hypothetical protein
VTAPALTGNLRVDAAVLVVAGALGLLGGLAQAWVTKDPADGAISPVKSGVIGVVAAVGVLWAQVPDTTLALVGQSVLTGYFGRAVLAMLQTRVTAALERDRKARAVAVAEDALRLAGDKSPDRETVSVRPEIVALRARLADCAASAEVSR